MSTTEQEQAPPESVALARLPDMRGVERGFELPEGSIHASGLSLTNPDTTFEEWTEIGHRIGHFRRWSQFALGDWILFGEAIYGEESAQAVEGTTSERYDVANRVTGLQVPTLQRYALVCGRVPLPIRREELDFGCHHVVSGLERPDQIYWLQEAVENAYTEAELRQAIRDHQAPPAEDGDGEVVDPPLSVAQQIEEAARLVYNQAQPTSDGGALVAAEPWHQLAAALGEE